MVSEEYAWLYFDMERYEEALKWVLEAIENGIPSGDSI